MYLCKQASIYIKSFVCQCVMFCLSPGDKQFVCPPGTFFVGGGGNYDDVDEEIDVSEASKLSAGARIFRGP